MSKKLSVIEYDKHWLNVGTRLTGGLGPIPGSRELLPPLTDVDRQRIVSILNKLPIVDNPIRPSIDG